MRKIILTLIILVNLFGCHNNSNGRNNNEDNDYKKIETIDPFTKNILQEDTLKNLFNPLFNLSNLLDSHLVKKSLSNINAKQIVFKPKEIQVINDSLLFPTEKNIVCFINILDKESDSKTVYKYLGYSETINMHLLEVQLYESSKYILLDNKTNDTYLINGYPYFSEQGNKFISFYDEAYPSYFSIIEIYSLDSNSKIKIKKEADFWSDLLIEKLEWSENDIYIKSIKGDESTDQLSKINLVELNDLINNGKKESKEQEVSTLWNDVFYLYPFDESQDNIGTYYVLIEKNNPSTFATSFNYGDIKFRYNVVPYCDNDTMYIVEENSPNILAKITKIGNDYFIKSDLIKVFSEDIKPEKYGYKLKKGYPEE